MSLKGDYYLVLKEDVYRLLKDAKKQKIHLYHLREHDDNSFQFVASYLDRTTILNTFSYVEYQCSIGLFHFISLYFIHKYRIIGLICGCCWFVYLHQLTFGCIIEDTYPSITKDLYILCENYQLTSIQHQLSYEEINQIETEIHQAMSSQIDYFDLYQEGRIYKIKYTKKLPSKLQESSYTSLVSTQDAIIDKIDIVSGNVLVSLGQYVTKGEVLVTNEIITTSNEVTFVPVEGKIYAYVYHTFEATMAGTLDPDSFTYLYQEISKQVENEILEDGEVIDENVLQYHQKEGKIILRIQFTLYQNIAKKEIFNE